MDNDTHTTPVESTAHLDLDVVRRTCNAAFINHNARDVNFKDCVTTVTFTSAPAAPSDFRRIPLGDINLLHEIHVNYNSRIVNRHIQVPVRRVHSAQVEGRSITAVVYQGEGAEEDWRRDLEKHMSLWHPNIIQIYGTASARGKHATLYHDELIPFQHFRDLYRHSHFLTVYLYACSNLDYQEADNYFWSKFQQDLWSPGCTFWIRRSTGQLCIELIPNWNRADLDFNLAQDAVTHRIQGNYLLSASVTDALVIDALTLETYYEICHYYLDHPRHISISTPIPVKPGSVIHYSSSSQPEDLTEIVSMPVPCYIRHWRRPNSLIGDGMKMKNGWTRFRSNNAFNARVMTCVYPQFCRGAFHDWWLAQANHVFSRLGITSNLEDYVLVNNDPPAGFLFLCPGDDFQTGPLSFRWPDCPAYWSLDPWGVDRLSMEEATQLGFPLIQQTTEVWGCHWDDRVYAGLRHFDQGKGFDPDSQDVARHLGYPLFKLSSKIGPPFAHVLDVLDEGDLNALFTEDNSGTSASDSADEEDSWAKENDQDSSSSNDESEDIKSSVGDNDEFSAHELIASRESPDVEPFVPQDEIVPVPWASKLLMNVQVALFLLLALFWLCDQA
ncbi:hypothetical protein MVEN_02154400 [Mycena venus]|uniref:Uncharacterized protein n=1 Tax=Mycena venus TaxID=2733690 RepID=A0A8H7CGU2_9AGAR|nr:hypothetical protein MVEN_02154400 [Mycena venus]